uniref:Uncharacterized protein n=1 Tax=Rhizophora mucronata TaxID=61149 RepID=A0A2P2PHC2_RHIMU
MHPFHGTEQSSQKETLLNKPIENYCIPLISSVFFYV